MKQFVDLLNPDPIDGLEKRAIKAVEFSREENKPYQSEASPNIVQRMRRQLNPVEVVHYDACELMREIKEYRQSSTYIRSRPTEDWFGKMLNGMDSKGAFRYGYQVFFREKQRLTTELPELDRLKQSTAQEMFSKFDNRLKKLEKQLEIYYPSDRFLPKEFNIFIGGSLSIACLFYLLGNFDGITVDVISKAAEISNIEGLESFAHFLHSIEKSDLWHEYMKYIYNVYGLGYVVRKSNVTEYLPEGSKIQQLTNFIANNTKMDFNSEGDGEKQVQNAFFIWLINKFLHSPFVH
jgi:hypothetical protein